MKYLQAWTSNLSEGEKKELVAKLKEAEVVFDRLSSILDQRVKSSVDTQHSSQKYDNPSWPLFQADSIGYQRAMREVIELITERK